MSVVRLPLSVHGAGDHGFVPLLIRLAREKRVSAYVNRMGYGATQLAGPQVWGPPRDPEEALRVLREAFDAGVNQIDTSDFYGPHVTNQIIKQALHPYQDRLVIVTKVGARRLADKSWVHALSGQELIDAIHDNLRNLGLDQLDVVNLRVGGVSKPSKGSIEEPLTVLADCQTHDFGLGVRRWLVCPGSSGKVWFSDGTGGCAVPQGAQASA